VRLALEPRAIGSYSKLLTETALLLFWVLGAGSPCTWRWRRQLQSCKSGNQYHSSCTFIWIGRFSTSPWIGVLTTLFFLGWYLPSSQAGIAGTCARIKLERRLINVSRYVERWW